MCLLKTDHVCLLVPTDKHISYYELMEGAQRDARAGCTGAVANLLRADREDARTVNNRDKQLITLDMSCPQVSNRNKNTSKNTMEYAPLRWELEQRYPGYEINQCNIILDVLG